MRSSPPRLTKPEDAPLWALTLVEELQQILDDHFQDLKDGGETHRVVNADPVLNDLREGELLVVRK